MSKIIGAFVIILFIVAGWKLVGYYKQVAEEERSQKKAEQGADIKPEQLGGMPYQLDQSLQAATKNGPAAMREWLKLYGPQISDPRKAWIEMSYCVAVMREDPIDAKRVFQTVKERTPTNSPVFPRVQQLERTFE
jgi:hypothetical protein